MLSRVGFHGMVSSLLILAGPAWMFAQADDVGLIIQIAAEDETDDDDDDVSQEVTVEVEQDGKTLTITQTVDGEFVGEIVENDETTKIKAGSLDDLEEKFPAAHAAFTAKPVVPVAKPGEAAAVSMQMTENDGDRKVEIQEPGRKLVLRDQRGKDIEITVKQELEHGTRTERYEAEDLESLQGKFPQIAQVYQKHVAGAGNGAINFQIQGAIGRIGGVPQGQGVRKIAGEHKGQRVVIKDENGKRIRISLTKTDDGEETTEDYEADDLASLKKQHPDIARIYEKLAGKNAPPGPQQFGVFNGNGVQIQFGNQGIPAPAVPEPAEKPAAITAMQLRSVKGWLDISQKKLLKLAADEKNADADELKKLSADIAAIAKKIEELEAKKKE